jgi:hypothetical protein
MLSNALLTALLGELSPGVHVVLCTAKADTRVGGHICCARSGRGGECTSPRITISAAARYN